MTDAEIQRIKRFPAIYKAQERKMEALRREAERYGYHELLRPDRQA